MSQSLDFISNSEMSVDIFIKQQTKNNTHNLVTYKYNATSLDSNL